MFRYRTVIQKYCIKGVFKNFDKIDMKTSVVESLFYLSCRLNFIKKVISTHAFSCKFCKIFENSFLQNTSKQVFLSNATLRASDHHYHYLQNSNYFLISEKLSRLLGKVKIMACCGHACKY